MELDLSSKKTKLEINQLYHPTGKLKMDLYEKVYSNDLLNIYKFVPILLKEWFYLVKRGGFLVIDYIPNKICDQKTLEKQMSWLWKSSFQIVSHDYIDDQSVRFICQKLVDTSIENDDIRKWTFGIITNGKRPQWVEQIIKSIRQQNIPHCEIIICGTYHGKAKNIVYIPFNKRDDKGWITKKKNLIARNAKFENICMMHDRIVLDKNWYQGMKKWGNCFENLGCRQLFEGVRVNDWMASHYFINNREGEKFSFESSVDYKDWYRNIWFLGQLNIFKKSIITKNNLWWDETLYYGEKEDYQFSKNLNDNGFIHRFNNYSSVMTLTNKYVNPTWIVYDPYALDPRMQLNIVNAFLKFYTYLFLKLLTLFGINFSFKTLENIRGKIYTAIRLLKKL